MMEPTITVGNWLTIGGMLFATGASIIGAMWKMVRGPLQNDLDGLGKRVGEVEKEQANAEAARAELLRRSDQHESELKYFRETLTRIDEQMATLEDHSTVAKQEIIDMFQRFTNQILEKMHQLDKEFFAFKKVLEDRETRLQGHR